MGGKPACKRVDQNFDTVLGAHRATDRRDDGGDDRGMRKRPPLYIAGEKRKGSVGVPTSVSVLHLRPEAPSRLRTRHEFQQRNNRPWGSTGTRPNLIELIREMSGTAERVSRLIEGRTWLKPQP